MPVDSVIAIVTKINGVILSLASGFLPIADKALEAINPSPIAGPSAPNPIASAAAKNFKPSVDIVSL